MTKAQKDILETHFIRRPGTASQAPSEHRIISTFLQVILSSLQYIWQSQYVVIYISDLRISF